jgi:hypothetical protein
LLRAEVDRSGAGGLTIGLVEGGAGLIGAGLAELAAPASSAAVSGWPCA